MLSDAERLDLWRAVAEAVTVPVIAGTGYQRHRPLDAADQGGQGRGASGVLVVTPYYSRPSQPDCRPTSGPWPTPPTCRSCSTTSRCARAAGSAQTSSSSWPARSVNIVGVKDAHRRRRPRPRVVAEAPDGFEVYCGDDPLTLPLLAVGGVGIVSVAAHWAGRCSPTMVAAFAERRHRRAPPPSTPAVRVLPVRVDRRVPEPGAGQGRLPGPRPARGPVPAAQRPCPVALGRPGPGGHGQAGSPAVLARQSVA